MTTHRSNLLSVPAALLFAAACSASPGGVTPAMGPMPSPADAGMAPSAPPPPPSAPPPPSDSCVTGAGLDFDGDGFPNGVDCNDCAAQINPGAFDAAGNGIDEDCDGADALEAGCDEALAMAPSEAMDAARAIGLCRVASAEGWGVLEARFTNADGAGGPRSMGQIGILPRFGDENAPREGSALLALSSGVARTPDQPGYTTDCDVFEDYDGSSGFPPTFPQDSSSCPGVRSGGVHDSVALEVTLRVPTNARGFSFSSAFFTYEYPEFICDEFNDFFAVLRGGDAQPWENIVFDSDGNPVSVNNALLRACEPGSAGGKVFACPLGRAPLAGTGFGATSLCGSAPPDPYGDPFDPYGDGSGGAGAPEVGAGTGWLRTVAPVTGGETITLRFVVWDSGDGDLDSTALIDGFEWELEPVMVTETVPDLI